MTDAQVQDFQKRVRSISKQHRKLSQGYVQLVERDGLLVPKTSRRARRGFPIKGLIITVVGFIAFKAFLFDQVGAINYNDRVQSLSKGTALEQAGGWVMQADPLTQRLSELLAGYL